MTRENTDGNDGRRRSTTTARRARARDALFGGGGGWVVALMRFAACNRLVVLGGSSRSWASGRRDTSTGKKSCTSTSNDHAACSKACRRLVVDGKRRR